MSYYWDHYRPAHRFWDTTTPDDEVFSTSSIAFACGIGRNSVRQIPVSPIAVHKGQRIYRRGDVMAWLIKDRELDDGSLLVKLHMEHLRELEKRGRLMKGSAPR